MFGLEKKARKPFEFDIEKEIKKDPQRKKEIFDLIETHTNQLKTVLKGGKAPENFDQCGILLQGYAALSKVLDKASKKTV